MTWRWSGPEFDNTRNISSGGSGDKVTEKETGDRDVYEPAEADNEASGAAAGAEAGAAALAEAGAKKNEADGGNAEDGQKKERKTSSEKQKPISAGSQ